MVYIFLVLFFMSDGTTQAKAVPFGDLQSCSDFGDQMHEIIKDAQSDDIVAIKAECVPESNPTTEKDAMDIK